MAEELNPVDTGCCHHRQLVSPEGDRGSGRIGVLRETLWELAESIHSVGSGPLRSPEQRESRLKC